MYSVTQELHDFLAIWRFLLVFWLTAMCYVHLMFAKTVSILLFYDGEV